MAAEQHEEWDGAGARSRNKLEQYKGTGLRAKVYHSEDGVALLLYGSVGPDATTLRIVLCLSFGSWLRRRVRLRSRSVSKAAVLMHTASLDLSDRHAGWKRTGRYLDALSQ